MNPLRDFSDPQLVSLIGAYQDVLDALASKIEEQAVQLAHAERQLAELRQPLQGTIPSRRQLPSKEPAPATLHTPEPDRYSLLWSLPLTSWGDGDEAPPDIMLYLERLGTDPD